MIGRDDAGRPLIVANKTAFHPLDHSWPDQPSDRGTITINAQQFEIGDAISGAIGPDDTALLLGEAIPVHRGEPGWTFVVAHRVSSTAAWADPTAGTPVRFAVDEPYRNSLSAAHTACHLMSLALNEHLSGFWSKTVKLDSLGHSDFDQAAVTESRITPFASVDHYRLGKSLRKSGFNSALLAEWTPKIQESVNATLAKWLTADCPVQVETDGPYLSDRRWWVCELPEGTARIPCGGTHPHTTGAIGSVTVTLELLPSELTARTVMTPASVAGS
jgi:alanyl-tRNA synthetase